MPPYWTIPGPNRHKNESGGEAEMERKREGGGEEGEGGEKRDVGRDANDSHWRAMKASEALRSSEREE